MVVREETHTLAILTFVELQQPGQGKAGQDEQEDGAGQK